MNSIDDIKIDIAEIPEPIQEGIYTVKITNIIKQEPRINPFTQMEETRIKFEFLILDSKEKGKKLFSSVTPKLALEPKTSNLYKIWSACVGRNPKKDEFGEFHLSSLIGKTLKVLVNQTEKNDRVFSNIESYLKIEKEAEMEETIGNEDDLDEIFGKDENE